jgi:hypothetical protein
MFIIRASVRFVFRALHADEDMCWTCVKHKRWCDCGRFR